MVKLAQLFQVVIHFHPFHPQLKTINDSSDTLKKWLLNLREVRTGKISVEFFFCKFMQARSINLQNKNETYIFPVRTEQASSIKFLLLWFCFEFPDGTTHFICDNARATIRRENLFLLRHNFCPNFWSDSKKQVST